MPRYSLRTLMIVVTIVAVGCGVWVWGEKRRKEFRYRSIVHSVAPMGLQRPAWRYYHIEGNKVEWTEPRTWRPYREYHKKMEEKYRRAARYPWLPVKPDPPEPKRW